MARTREKASQIDWSSLSLNVKNAQSTSAATLSNGIDNNLAANGAAVSFTVKTNCTALIIVNVGVGSTTDFEFKPEVFLDGTVYSVSGYTASLNGSASNRAIIRPYSVSATLMAGSHTISAGVFITSSTSPHCDSGNANISVIVFGEVTA